MQKNKNLLIENARILFRNFSGKEGQFNPPGRRNFCVIVDDAVAERLETDGWNVRWLQPRDEYETPRPYLQVAVRFDNFPPKVVIVSSKGKTVLDEEAVALLDWVEIEKVDLTINPSSWVLHKGTKGEKSGVKAYLKSIYVTIVEDDLENKYYDVPDSAVNSIGGCGQCDACDGSCNCSGH